MFSLTYERGRPAKLKSRGEFQYTEGIFFKLEFRFKKENYGIEDILNIQKERFSSDSTSLKLQEYNRRQNC